MFKLFPDIDVNKSWSTDTINSCDDPNVQAIIIDQEENPSEQSLDETKKPTDDQDNTQIEVDADSITPGIIMYICKIYIGKIKQLIIHVEDCIIRALRKFL